SAHTREGIHVSGALTFAATDSLEVLGRTIALAELADHRGIDLRARVTSLPRDADALAVVPEPLDGSPVDSAWLAAIRGGPRGPGLKRPPGGSPGRGVAGPPPGQE